MRYPKPRLNSGIQDHTHIDDGGHSDGIVERLRNGGGRFTGVEEHSAADRFGDDHAAYTDCYTDPSSRCH